MVIPGRHRKKLKGLFCCIIQIFVLVTSLKMIKDILEYEFFLTSVKNTVDLAVNTTFLVISKTLRFKNILATLLKMTTAMEGKLFQQVFNVFHWSIVRFWFANTFLNFTKLTDHMAIWTNVTIFSSSRMARDILTNRALQIKNLLASKLLIFFEIWHFEIALTVQCSVSVCANCKFAEIAVFTRRPGPVLSCFEFLIRNL